MKHRKRRLPLPEHVDLPRELWREVFARLPSKSLLRFRCVCKNWCSLIDSCDFISMHLNLYRNNSSKTQLFTVERLPKTGYNAIFTIRRSDTFRKIGQLHKLDEISWDNNVMIDGLMLVHILSNTIPNSDELCLWNPSIRKLLILPRCPIKCIYPYASSFIGFSPSSNDYKVVAFEIVSVKESEIAIAIYSLRDHLWSVIHSRLKVPSWYFGMVQCSRGAVFLRGALYRVPPYFEWPSYGEDIKLVSFDFDAKEFSYLMLPNIDEQMFRILFLFGGSLAFFCISSVRSCIWVMEKGAGNELWRQCWERDTNVDVYELFRGCPPDNYQILYIEDTSTLLVQCSKKLMAYNIITNQAQCLGKSIRLSYVQIYVESLLLHKEPEGVTLISDV